MGKHIYINNNTDKNQVPPPPQSIKGCGKKSLRQGYETWKQ